MSESRLKTYALTATGTATLATAGIASAEIETSSGATNILANTPTTLFTVGGGIVKAFNWHTGSWSDSGYATAGFGTGGLSSLASFATVNGGSSIGTGFSGATYASFSMFFANNAMTSSQSNGMSTGTSVLMGVSISDGTDTFYGWINYTLSMFEGDFTFTINRWAYNDVANEGIIAGQNQAAGSSAVPGLGGLAALAIGAAGVRSRRQRTVA